MLSNEGVAVDVALLKVETAVDVEGGSLAEKLVVDPVKEILVEDAFEAEAEVRMPESDSSSIGFLTVLVSS